MQTPIRQKRPNFRIPYFCPSKSRPSTVPPGADVPFAPPPFPPPLVKTTRYLADCRGRSKQWYHCRWRLVDYDNCIVRCVVGWRQTAVVDSSPPTCRRNSWRRRRRRLRHCRAAVWSWGTIWLLSECRLCISARRSTRLWRVCASTLDQQSEPALQQNNQQSKKRLTTFT